MLKPKKEEAVSLSKYERFKLQKLQIQGGAAYGSVCYLVKASNLSVSKVTRFWPSKPSFVKSILAARKFKNLKIFARFKKS